MVFTLGEFVPILDKMTSVQNRLHNHKVLSLEDVKDRLSEIKNVR